MRKVLSIIIFVFLLISCKENVNSPIEENIVQVNIADDLIPSKIGNEWVYEDTLRYPDHWSYSTFNTKISKEEMIEGKRFYEINELFLGIMGLGKYTIQNGKIYKRLIGSRGQDTVRIKYVPATLESVTYSMAISGDNNDVLVTAKHIKAKYKVGTLIFSEYFQYTCNYSNYYYKLIIVPGVGVVDYFLTSDNSYLRTSLIKYTFK